MLSSNCEYQRKCARQFTVNSTTSKRTQDLGVGLLLCQRRRRRANIELLFCFKKFQIFPPTHDTDSARFGVCDLKKPCYREDDYAV